MTGAASFIDMYNIPSTGLACAGAFGASLMA